MNRRRPNLEDARRIAKRLPVSSLIVEAVLDLRFSEREAVSICQASSAAGWDAFELAELLAERRDILKRRALQWFRRQPILASYFLSGNVRVFLSSDDFHKAYGWRP